MFRSSSITLAIVALSFSLSQNRPSEADRSTADVSTLSPRNPFIAGERLVYDVSWADFIVAAEFTIETDQRRSFDGVDGYHVTAQAKTVGLVNGLFKVNDIYESFIDSATLKPFRAEKRSRHGKNQTQSSVTIDQVKRTAQLGEGRTLEIPEDTYDLAALIFAIRGMDLTLGKTRSMTVFEDGKLYTINLKPEAREKVTTRAGSYETVKIATSRIKGRENDKLYNLSIYITADAARMPVLITAEPSWGSVRVELTSATGTKRDERTDRVKT